MEPITGSMFLHSPETEAESVIEISGNGLEIYCEYYGAAGRNINEYVMIYETWSINQKFKAAMKRVSYLCSKGEFHNGRKSRDYFYANKIN